jgi:hypothetical protein
MKSLGTVAHVATVVFAAMMAMQQLGVGRQLIAIAFAVILGSVCLALALACGLGGREVAGKIVQMVYELGGGCPLSGGAVVVAPLTALGSPSAHAATRHLGRSLWRLRSSRARRSRHDGVVQVAQSSLGAAQTPQDHSVSFPIRDEEGTPGPNGSGVPACQLIRQQCGKSRPRLVQDQIQLRATEHGLVVGAARRQVADRYLLDWGVTTLHANQAAHVGALPDDDQLVAVV